MRVYDWAAAAKDRWFIFDGTHYTPRGYAARARRIANALAAAFPRGSPVAGSPHTGQGTQSSRRPACLVR
jgi:hypothetical protein